MSSSNRFTEDELEALLPWQLPEVGAEETKTNIVEEEVDEALAITVEEIAALQKQAFDEAEQQGRDNGYQEGQKKGHVEGYKKGYDTGYEEGMAKAEQDGQRIQQLLGLLSEPLKELDEQIEQELVTLAMQVARHLVRREIKAEPGQVLAVVREAIAALPSSSRKVYFYLHPDDAELVRSAFTIDKASANWEITEDPTLTRGGCRVNTDVSRIDATVEKRLADVIAHSWGDERSV